MYLQIKENQWTYLHVYSANLYLLWQIYIYKHIFYWSLNDSYKRQFKIQIWNDNDDDDEDDDDDDDNNDNNHDSVVVSCHCTTLFSVEYTYVQHIVVNCTPLRYWQCCV